jgi:hypothetical protein
MNVLRQSCAVFCRHLRICDLGISRENLRICDLWTGTQKKFADLQERNEIKNLQICGL